MTAPAKDQTERVARVRRASAELRESIRDLIDGAPMSDIRRLFDRVYPRQATLNIRAARLAMFNAGVSWVAAEIRAERREIVSKSNFQKVTHEA